MAASARNIACFALLVAILALQVPSCVDQRGTSAGTPTAAITASTSASASAPTPLHGAPKPAMLALAGMDALLIAAAVIYSRHTHHAAGAVGAGGGNWRVTELAFFVLCLQVGVLQFVLFVQEPAAAGDAAARALGISAGAAHALPCVASVTFFLGITLIYAHVGNGGGAVAGNGPVLTLGAALACLMSIILALFYINTK